MKIEFWCDIICPFCGLAEHCLEKALAMFEHRTQVEVIHRSFQLHPELHRNGVSQRDLLVMRGRVEAETQVLRPIEQAAAREGLIPFRAIDRTDGPCSRTTGLRHRQRPSCRSMETHVPDAFRRGARILDD